MACCSCNPDKTSHYNDKSSIVTNFTTYVKKKRMEFQKASERQLEIYDNYIKDLELCPKSTTMRDIRYRHIIVEDYMECECQEEDDNKCYQKIFDDLWLELRRCVREEIRLANRMVQRTNFKVAILNDDYCWTKNVHICPECKYIYDRTVKFGLMNEDYSWKDTTTQNQIAEWVDLFAKKFNLSKHWVWAEEVWGIKNLKQRKHENYFVKDRSKLDIVYQIFETEYV